MKVVGKGLTLIGGEGSCPPLPYIEVSEDEGKALIGIGHAVEYAGPEAEAEKSPSKSEAKAADKAAKAEAEAAEAEAKAKAKAALAEDRAQLIAEAIHLVEPEGLGEDGKPTVDSIQAITDLTDVTADEIDAALAAHDTSDA